MPATPSTESTIIAQMENIKPYAGGGGTTQATFISDAYTIYQLMLRDPHEQERERFGRWEYLNLLGVTMASEASEVHNAFMDEWNHEYVCKPNYQRARRVERAQVP